MWGRETIRATAAVDYATRLSASPAVATASVMRGTSFITATTAHSTRRSRSVSAGVDGGTPGKGGTPPAARTAVGIYAELDGPRGQRDGGCRNGGAVEASGMVEMATWEAPPDRGMLACRGAWTDGGRWPMSWTGGKVGSSFAFLAGPRTGDRYGSTQVSGCRRRMARLLARICGDAGRVGSVGRAKHRLERDDHRSR